MPERPDFHELDDPAQPQTALNGRDLADEAEGYSSPGRRLIPSSVVGCSPTA
jgi:hypothetical protein